MGKTFSYWLGFLWLHICNVSFNKSTLEKTPWALRVYHILKHLWNSRLQHSLNLRDTHKFSLPEVKFSSFETEINASERPLLSFSARTCKSFETVFLGGGGGGRPSQSIWSTNFDTIHIVFKFSFKMRRHAQYDTGRAL